MRVWVDSWQMQCCGDPIRVGGEVRWTLQEPDLDFARTVLGDTVAMTITHAEEHHGGLPGDTPATVGTVTAIKAVFCMYAAGRVPFERTLYPVTGSAVVRDRAEADGWEPEDGGLQFVSYLVDLSA
jgi:hypothetical protein